MSEGTSRRGFASLTKERMRQIATMGGKAVPAGKRSFSQNRKLAVESGRKGGKAVKAKNRSFSQDRELASRAGTKGGQNVPPEKRGFSQHPELAAEAGRKGGLATGKAARANAESAED